MSADGHVRGNEVMIHPENILKIMQGLFPAPEMDSVGLPQERVFTRGARPDFPSRHFARLARELMMQHESHKTFAYQ
jgi:hypothetical protein